MTNYNLILTTLIITSILYRERLPTTVVTLGKLTVLSDLLLESGDSSK